MRSRTALLSITIIFWGAASVLARPLERVPQDGTLEQAIRRVNNRGVIEIADDGHAGAALLVP